MHALMCNEVFISHNVPVCKKGLNCNNQKISTLFHLHCVFFAGLDCQRGAFKANRFLEIESVSGLFGTVSNIDLSAVHLDNHPSV